MQIPVELLALMQYYPVMAFLESEPPVSEKPDTTPIDTETRGIHGKTEAERTCD